MMPLDRLTWIGLTLVAMGWVLLLMGGHLSELTGETMERSLLQLDLPAISQGLMLSGFGLAILGALQSGFGALNRFFAAVLERSANPKPQPPQAIPVPKRQQNPITQTGRIRDRSYVLFADGSVDVETLLGVRRFPSLSEAQAFIGA